MTLKSLFPIFISLSCLLYAWNIKRDNPIPMIQISEQKRQLNFNKDILNVVSLGQQRLISSILWVQTLLDSDLEHYKGKDLNSWMYLRFDTITELDPMFYQAYLWGGIYLSVVKDDALGASEIYNKGLGVYPADMDLSFNAGFNSYFELGDLKQAINHFENVLLTPEGIRKYPRLVSLLERMKRKDGIPYYDILNNLKTRYDSIKSPAIRKYIEMTMYSVKATADLLCLNSEKTNCENLDLYGEQYQKIDGQFVAPRKFKEFKLYK